MIEMTPPSEAADGVFQLRLSGSLDLATRSELERTLQELVDGGATHLRIDLSGVDYLGSVALAVVINTAKTLRRRGGELRLVTGSPQTRRHLKLLNLESLLDEGEQPS